MVNVPDWVFAFGVGGFMGGIGVLVSLLRMGWLQETFSGFIDSYIAQMVDNFEKNPQSAAKFVKPLLTAAMKEIGVQTQGGMKSINFFGFKIPGEFVGMALERFMPKLAQQGAEQAVNRLLPG